MQSNNQPYRLPFQTKIVFGFVLLLTVALISKWAFYSFVHVHQPSQNEQQLSGIKSQVAEICLKEESKSIKSTSEANEDDQDWINFKAPEYCKCLSSRLVSYWGEKSKIDQINKISRDEVTEYITTQLKGEESKGFVDFCLSKAQKVSSKKTASAQ
tara:strand:- start:38479 stop:38946 length:468 start_codon:yes stop_codon:yes gene_type:complete